MPLPSPPAEASTGLYFLILALALAAAGYVLYRRWLSRRELERRLVELSQLAELGRAILSARLDSSRLAELIYQQAGRIVDATFFQLGVFEGERYRMLIWVMDGERQPPLTVELTPDTLGIVGWMRASRQSLLVRDFNLEMDRLPARPRYVSENPPRSAIFVPLLAGDRVLGGLSIQSRRPAAFSEEHLRLVAIIANNASAAFETARLFEQTQRRAAQLQLLAELGRRINVLQPLPAFYRQAVELVSEQFGEYQVSIFSLDNGVLQLAATTRADWRAPARAVPEGAETVTAAAAQRRTVIVPAESAGAAEIAVPLQIDDRVLGVLHVRGQPAEGDEAGLSLFESLAAQIAFATLEAQVYAAEQRRAEQLAALAQTSRSVASTLELGDLLEEVLELVEERFGYHRARVFLVQDDRLVFQAGTDAWAARWGFPPVAYALDGPGLIALAGRSQQPVLVREVAAHPDYTPGPGLEDTRTEMAAPLVMAGRLLGVFDVQSEQPEAYGADDLQTLQTLADTLAVAVRNARLFEAERRRRRLAETLREVSIALTSTLSLDGVLDLILSGLARVMTFDVAALLLVNDVGELCLRAARTSRAEAAEAPLGQVVDIPLFSSQAAPPSVVNFHDLDQRHEYHDLFGLPEPHACLAATLVLQSEHLGYLVVDRVGILQFPPEEAELIGAFASQASVAIENARLYTAQREQAWVSTALLQVADTLAQSASLEETLSTVVRVAPVLIGVSWCAVLLAVDERYELRGYHHTGDGPVLDLPAGVRAAEWPKLAEMITAQEPAVSAPDDPAPEALRELLEGVAILLPLWIRGEVQGALIVGQTAGEAGQAAFTAHRIRLIGGIANQASLALESALLDEAQQEEAWVNAALLQVAEAVAGQPTLAEALDTIVRLTPMLVGVEQVAIFSWQPGAERFVLQEREGLTLAANVSLTAAAADLSVDPFTPNSASELCRLPAPLAAAFGGELALAWPLWSRRDLRGALVVGPVAGLGRRLSILNGIAHQLAMAMENAALAGEVAQQQRTEREMELGRDIQASFLPEACPQAPGWGVAAFWRSARMVGGDFYDFIRLRSPDGVERWGVAVADVSDKGVPAALFMALSRTLLRSAAMSRLSPAATLTRVNELILADARSQQFVTMFYGVWEPATGRFVYANAGHNPPVLMRAGADRPETLTAHGAALGVFAEYIYTDAEIVFEPGTTLLIYTDGLTDAINAQAEEFGLARVEALLQAAQALPAASIVDTLAQTVDWHVGGVEAFDDTTLVAVQRVAG